MKKFLDKEVGFEHLHLHSDFSILDGYGMVEEYAERAKKINQKYLCISDHGMLGAVPRQIRACEENGISPIHAIELYIQPGHINRESFDSMDPLEKKKIRKSYHLLAIAYNDVGYKNIVQMSSWAWEHGFYYKPRVNYEVVKKHKEGVIFTSCCYNSEIGQAFDTGGKEAADNMIKRYVDMFGENFYLEIMLLDFHKQKPYNEYIVDAAARLNLPTIVTQDTHYCNKEDSKYQRYMLMIQKDTTVKDIETKLQNEDRAEIFELQDENLWMKSEYELNEKWVESYQNSIPFDFLNTCKENTVKICQKAKGVKLDKSIKLPKIENADEKFKEALIRGFKWRGLAGKEYERRLKEEYELITRKEFSSYFLIQKKIVDEARRIAPEVLGWGDGWDAIGVGRGSSVSSLACYCLGITDIDPIQHKLLFSRFLSPARGGKMLKTRFTKPPIKIGSPIDVVFET